jgi:hypothetical protein
MRSTSSAISNANGFHCGCSISVAMCPATASPSSSSRSLPRSPSFERERIGERIRDAKWHQRRIGQYLGGDRPFGWQIGEDGVLIEDEAEQRALAEMRALRETGASYRRIAAQIKQAHGIEISHQGVKRVIGRSL